LPGPTQSDNTGCVPSCVGQEPCSAFTALRRYARPRNIAAYAGHAGAAALASVIGAPAHPDNCVERGRRPELTVVVGVFCYSTTKIAVPLKSVRNEPPGIGPRPV